MRLGLYLPVVASYATLVCTVCGRFLLASRQKSSHGGGRGMYLVSFYLLKCGGVSDTVPLATFGYSYKL